MEKEQRRIQRFEQGLPIKISLRDGPDGPLLAGPTPGNLTNISASGAGITIAKVFIDNYHLFYSPRDNPENILCLDLDLSDNEDKFVSIPVRPIWLDRIQSSTTQNDFAMGVEFIITKEDIDLKRLIHLIQTKHHEGGNWLRNLVEKLFSDWKG